MTLGHTNSPHLIIQKIFKKHFLFLGTNDIYHFSLSILKRNLINQKENVKISNGIKVFKDQENTLQIYNKKDAKFNGIIILSCPSSLFLNSLNQMNTIETIVQKSKNNFLKGCSRFGTYISKRNFPSKTFIFHQMKSNDFDIEIMKETEHNGFLVSGFYSPINLENLDQFLDFITDYAFHKYQ